jgi:hypothetical protein
VLLLGSGYIRIVGFTPKNYATLFLFLLLFVNIKKSILPIDKNVVLYIAFAIYFFITLLITGEINSFDSNTYFGGQILPSIVIFISVCKYIKSYKELKIICYFLLIMSVFNSIISIFQFYGNPIAQQIGMFFGTSNNFTYDDVDYNITGLGTRTVIGIFGGIVTNGFMISSLFALASVLYTENRLSKMVAVVVMILPVLAMYYTQQRSAFVLIICCLCVMIFKTFGLKKMIFSLILLIPFLFFISMPDIDYGRFDDFQDDTRNMLYSKSMDWIKDNCLIGGPVAAERHIQGAAHNIFLSAFSFGGIISFIILSVIYFRTIFSAIKNIFKSFKKHSILSNYICALSLCIICVFANGLTHNISIVYGYLPIWFLYAVFVRSIQLDKE